jgi:hypothetical protein
VPHSFATNVSEPLAGSVFRDNHKIVMEGGAA